MRAHQLMLVGNTPLNDPIWLSRPNPQNRLSSFPSASPRGARRTTMKRALWIKLIGLSLAVVAMIPGLAWADPAGGANILQIQSGRPRDGSLQRAFLTTDSVSFEATYYDPAPACDGVAPVFVQLFVFNSEGLFIGQFSGFSNTGSPGFTKFRTLQAFLAVGALPVGSYQFTFLVRTCNDTDSAIVPEFVAFRVIAP